MRLIDVSVLKEWVENWFTKNRLYHPYAKNNNIPITELYDILEQMPSAQTDPDTDLEILSSGVWDAKELPTTQPDKIEVHLQEPYALMIKEVIVKETTYRMATKQETVGELTRCKDCKHYKTYISCIGDEYSGCDYWINDGNEPPCEPTDFCSYAERREVTT